MKSIIEVDSQAPNTVSASNAVFNVGALTQLTSFANLMADSTVAVPEHLVGKPADCMAIVMQAMQWGMNPYAVAQKTHLVSGKLGYEAQLVNAVISSSNAISGRFHYEYGGDWSKCSSTKEITVKKKGRNGEYSSTERVRGWSDADEVGLYIRVGAVLRGEKEITWGEKIHLSSVVIRNSPLWVSNPKQQIAYLALKYWSRLYCPDVILGVYTPDELEQRQEKEVNPMPEPQERVNLHDIGDEVVVTHEHSVSSEEKADIEVTAQDFRESIDAAETAEEARGIGEEVDAMKVILGVDLHTELRNKAVKRYHQIIAQTKISALINDLPNSDEPDAPQRFADLEQSLQAAKSRLGADLYEGFTITLADMKPEYCS
ncbi:RecT family recombinase [Buttiauxella sp. S19-1]|uniref:RecT family recombinase n=1 Tax=Buttiauxella sp. S19-1 TaxID=941430 RepID=UPI001EDABAAC|nr:RecT family recombinase [Buttiauxella sp. S19-1]